VAVLKSFAFEKADPGLRGLVTVASIFFSLTLIFALHRYFTLYASYDQGIFNQVFWNGMHGRFFQSSLSSALSTNVVHDAQVPEVFYHRLGQHFTPALLLWLPLYSIFPSPVTLVVLQVILMTAGGVVLYALARHYLPPTIALFITAGYYASNAVIGAVFWNFHDLSQLSLFVFGLLLALEKRIWWLFWLLAGLTVLIREDTGVVLFGIGVYMVVSRRFPRSGLVLCALSFGYIMLVTKVLMAMFSQDVSKRFMLERFGQFADGNEASTLEIILGILSNPIRLFYELFLRRWDQKLLYLLAQALPLALIPLAAPYAWVIAGFPLLQLFLQNGESQLSIHIRYAVTVVPGFFYGTILWWSHHKEKLNAQLQILKLKVRFRRVWATCIGLSLLIAFLYSPHRVFYFAIPDSYVPWVHVSLTRQWQHVAAVRPLMQQIPPDASVSATTYLIPPLSSRRSIVRLPYLQIRDDQNQVQDVDYIFADLWQLQQYQVAFKAERIYIQQIVPLVDQLLRQNQYGMVGVQDGVILLKKSSSSDPQALANWATLRQTFAPLLPNNPT
jgi:uncharacterized membrane protein